MSARDTKLKKDTLGYVNRLRKGAGLPRLTRLRKGRQGSSKFCPVARSLKELDAWVSPRSLVILNLHNHTLSASVREFVRLFDQGIYPDLELKSSPYKTERGNNDTKIKGT